MEIEEAIKERHSVRSYTNQKIEGNVKNELEQLIAECNKEGNLNTKLFLDEPKAFDTFMAHYGKFQNARNYIVLIGKKDKLLDEKCGYYGEKIVIKAGQLGLNTCWVGMTYGKRKVPYKLAKDEKICITISIGYGDTKGANHQIKTFEQVTNVKGEVPEWFSRGVESALLAPTAMNQQKFVFEFEENKVKVTAGNGFFTKVDLGIVKYHFEIGAGRENFNWAN